MRAVLQRVKEASVSVNNQVKGQINEGLCVLLGIEDSDEESDVEWLTKKISQLRIFSDETGKMNLDINDIKGGILVVSQFTLHAKTKKGNRPSFVRAANPEKSVPLYEFFIQKLSEKVMTVEQGIFGEHMEVSLINDGPVTIIIDTKNKE